MLPTSLASVRAFSTENADNPIARKTVDNGNKNLGARKAFLDLGVNSVQNQDSTGKSANKAKESVKCAYSDLFSSHLDDFLYTKREIDEDTLYAKHVAQLWADVFTTYMTGNHKEMELIAPAIEEMPEEAMDFANLSTFDTPDASFELAPIPEVDFAF